VTKEIADKIETRWKNWADLFYDIKFGKHFDLRIKNCFTNNNRFMQANMAKFLRKVSGQ